MGCSSKGCPSSWLGSRPLLHAAARQQAKSACSRFLFTQRRPPLPRLLLIPIGICHVCDVLRWRMQQDRPLPDDAEAQPGLVWSLDFAEEGNELLARVEEVAARIQDRCRTVLTPTEATPCRSDPSSQGDPGRP